MDETYQNKTSKKTSNKKKTKNNKRAEPKSAHKSDVFDFDNEIVIGVRKIPDNKNEINKGIKKEKSKQKKKKNNNQKKQNARKLSTKHIKGKNKEEETYKKNVKCNNNKKIKKNTKKDIIIKGIIKWTILLLALVASFIFFMMSPLFNIQEIEVISNEQISADTIISLSNITKGENIYKTRAKTIKQNIKQNAYIEDVDIKRKIPNKIIITVKERKATYMIEYANSYAYINNQGYILEITENKIEVPIIEGYTTPVEDIKVGNRLNNEDLEKLGSVLKIIESANANDIGNAITRISIKDKQNYIIMIESEKKTVYLGNASNLSNRMLYVKAVLKEEKGIEGEIFVNGDLNTSNVYFRKKE